MFDSKLLVWLVCLILSGCSNSEFKHSVDSPAVLRVMSFNVRVPTDNFPNNWTLRRHLVSNVLKEQQPDIIAFQEMKSEQKQFLLAKFPHYLSIGTGRNEDGSGEATNIFYNQQRLKLDVEVSGSFWFSDSPNVPGSKHWGNKHIRNATLAKFIDLTTGKPLTVVNNHWGYSQKFHLKAAKLVRQQINQQQKDNEAVVVLGDFNSLPKFKGLAELMAKESNAPLIDSWQVSDVDMDGYTFHDFTGKGFKRLDYIFLNEVVSIESSTKIIQSKWYNRWPSDHFPLMVKITL
ncbi:endonuclease/exonuclease/phosphatase family protein [Thalassotalea nanhaiensis]|uniref:Endonuclease/exonuclease/phosphatase family protein n=1 Tax=Thalassotalea nanhaiensis TaxID=3065648 RepID=A0ABY9TLD0_9GAMM|nr:endonuclease/exonuclease/phosphatase family protein [Colwelliaceae bacterium SQ345]